MTREIKFRIWDTINKTMTADEDHFSKPDWPVLIAIGLHGLPIVIDKDSFKQTEICGWNRDHNLILMEWTGLRDKNGVEIYEGDIVTHQSMPCVVTYQAPSFVMKKRDYHKTWHDFIRHPDENQFEEVIGNIHENPDLLDTPTE